ncbi:MAG: DUF58 domain-containing protein [Bacteroidales bacterium]
MLKGLKDFYITRRFYLLIAANVMVFIAGWFFDALFLAGKIALLLLFLATLADIVMLFSSAKGFLVTRELPEKFSNGDENEAIIYIKNNYLHPVSVSITDEVPFQFQIRDFYIHIKLLAKEEKSIKYTLKPVERGVYEFGKIIACIASPLGLILRRFCGNTASVSIKVYPSFLRMHQYQLLAISDRLNEIGINRVRRVGHHSEFDQIREYVSGDDYRTLNWKATARKNKFMVNQYQDERSQQVYSIIDMGRTMQMPFEGMTLLDYAINASLIISNTAIDKHDKAGIITFNTGINAFLAAERKNNTMLKILELLYDQKTLFAESNFELLYAVIRQKITHRSLLIIYSNFESLSSVQRQMNFIAKLLKFHLVLLIIFENTEVKKLTNQPAGSLDDIYISTIAEKFIHEKHVITKELNSRGVHTIYTKPQNLTVNLINKYLELKARGLV